MNKTGASKHAAGLKMQGRTHETYEQLIRRAASVPAIPTIIVHPCDESSLRGAVEATAAGIIVPILVGPLGKIRSAAKDSKLDISGFELVDAEHSHGAAVKAVALMREGRGEMLMKGSLHTDELMLRPSPARGGAAHRRGASVMSSSWTCRPIHEALCITDAAINIAPTLEDKARHRAERHRPGACAGRGEAEGGDPVGGRDRNSEDPLDHRGRGAMQDGGSRADHRRRCSTVRWPSTMPSAPRPPASRESSRRWQAGPDILLVPDLEAGNMLAKQLTYLAKAEPPASSSARACRSS